MSERYSIAGARTNLRTLVDQVERGRQIELTRRGTTVAVVVSLRDFQRLRGDRPRFSDAYRNFLKRHSLARVGLEDGFVESLRKEDHGREVSL